VGCSNCTCAVANLFFFEGVVNGRWVVNWVILDDQTSAQAVETER